jgi:hypothetical protein
LDEDIVRTAAGQGGDEMEVWKMVRDYSMERSKEKEG